MCAKEIHPQKPRVLDLESLRRRMVRELEEFLSVAMRLPLPRLKLKSKSPAKYQVLLT